MVTAYKSKSNVVNVPQDTFAVGDMDRLERFLIMGSIGGTYYVSQNKLTEDNLKAVENIVKKHGVSAVNKIVQVGKSNRAPKHDPVLVAYAIAVSDPTVSGYALSFFNDIVRTGTHLFHFMEYIKGRRGHGRALKRAISNWYLNRSPESLAKQLVKYKQRDGWSHRDVLRVAHPQATTQQQNGLLRYAVKGTLPSDDSKAHAYVVAAEEATHTTDVECAVDLIKEFGLPQEVINTALRKDVRVWEALVPTLGLTALVRNLRNMTKDGYLVQGSDAVRIVRERLLDEEQIRQSRIHPAQLWLAMRNATEAPDPIKVALEQAFELSFGNVEPTNKRIMLAIDCSDSMTWPENNVGGAQSREWAALVAMITARVEPYAEFRGFNHRFVNLGITARDSFDSIMEKIARAGHGATDCSLPMFWAYKEDQKFDAFVVYTDNETNSAGYRGRYGYKSERDLSTSSGNPMQELRRYRETSKINAKLIVVAMSATNVTIANPDDPFTLDVVGMDAGTPQFLSEFIAS